jgi:hypothetical protein
MPRGSDRGSVLVTEHADGTSTVTVCANIVDGLPVGIFATYLKEATVTISPEVAMTAGPRGRYTKAMAEVVDHENGVLVRTVR